MEILFIPIIILIIVGIILLFCKLGIKKNDEIQIIPPENMNPLELAYINNKKVTSADVISLIPYLVDKGYIKIEFPFSENTKKDINFRIIKNKEYNGNNALEKFFLTQLFENNNMVTYDELCNDVKYKSLFNFCTDAVNNERNYTIIFGKKSKKVKKIINILIIIGLLLYNFIFNAGHIILYFIQLIILTTIGASMNSSDIGISINGGKTKLKRNNWLIATILTVILIAFSCPFLVVKTTEEYTIMKEPVESIIYLIGILIFAIISILKGNIELRNKKGKEIYQKVVNFKDFLRFTPRESIEAEFNKNKDCYFDIFSYCFVLGMSDKCVTEYDKFFNNAWNILYSVVDVNKRNNTSGIEVMKIMEEYNENLKIEQEKFIQMLNNNYYNFLGKEYSVYEFKIDMKTYNENNVFNYKYILKSIKDWMLNS